jgi:penicillin-binding protein 2
MSVSEPPDGPRRPPLTPTLALRVAVVGSLTLALFAIVFFRLWFLQVLTGDQYVKEAAVNRTRNVAIAPARGEILDQSGNVLVDSDKTLELRIVPSELPVPVTAANITVKPGRRNARVYRRLAKVLRISTKPTHCRIPAPPPSCNTTTGTCPHTTTLMLPQIACTVDTQVALATYADVTIKRAVKPNVQYYIAERQTQFPGVEVDQVSTTHYPDGDLAAQVLGTVGQITQAELHQKKFKGVNRNATVGQTGLESQYDEYLRGRFGKQQVEVDSSGEPVSEGRTIEPKTGHNLVTSLDANVQRVGQEALARSVAATGDDGGAFIAMNPDNGQVYAMGSNPTFNPNWFTPALSEKHAKELDSVAANDPELNRAYQSVGPTGSTFKVITATAALESGDWMVNETFDDSADFHIGSETLQNSGGVHYGVINMVDAFRVSDDEFFYNLGAKTNSINPQGGPIQTWARRYGIGRKTGIDLPYESSGTLPDPAWRAHRNKEEAECEEAVGPFKYVDAAGTTFSPTMKKGYHRNSKGPSCGIADGDPWTIGDNVNLAVGQGDVQVTPLQLAVAYSALANGGTIVKPHIGEEITDADGTVLQKIAPPSTRKLDINPLYLDTIREGLHEAAQTPGGTSDDVMGNFGEQVYAKTGTAQYGVGVAGQTETDWAWYSAFVPATATSKPIEVVVWVPKGGFGDVAAAPVARQIMSEWFYGKPGPYIQGSSDDQ